MAELHRSALISAVGGVIREISPVPLVLGDPQLHLYRATIDNGPVWSPGTTPFTLDGAGVDFDDDVAQLKAAAEALEHYAAAVVDPGQLTRATAEKLGPTALDLQRLPRCLPEEQIGHRQPLAPPRRDIEMYWVLSVRLSDLERVWVPAELAFLRQLATSEAERCWLPSSTGCAVHLTPQRAILGGILECVERDAAALCWLTRTPLPRLVLDSHSRCQSAFQEVISAIESSLLTVELFDATSDLGLPTVYARSYGDEPNYRGNVVAVASHLDPLLAAQKALLEAVQMQVMLRLAPPAPTDLQEFSQVTDGAMFMSDARRAKEFDFLKNGKALPLSGMRSAIPGGVGAVVRHLASQGCELYVVDLTTSELKRLGLWAVRVLAPSLQPLSLFSWLQFKDSDRLRQICLSRGIRFPDGLNSFPQPVA